MSGAPGFGGFPSRVVRAGFDPSTLVTSWLHWGTSTVTGLGVSSLPDLVGGPAAIQATDLRRPAKTTLANGVVAGTFVDDILLWPVSGANNDATKRSFGFWYNPANVIGTKRILSAVAFGSGASATSFELRVSGSGFQVVVNIDAANTRQAALLTGTIATNVPAFLAWQYDGGQVVEADRCQLSVNAIRSVPVFTNPAGTGDMPATLVVPTGNLFLGAQNAAGGGPVTGVLGDIYCWQGIYSQAQLTNLMHAAVVV